MRDQRQRRSATRAHVPSALHHQQDVDLVLTLGVSGDGWGWGGKKRREQGKNVDAGFDRRRSSEHELQLSVNI